MTRYILALSIFSVFSTAANAQGKSGTPEDRAACQGSVQRYCSQSLQGGDMAVLACLQEKRAQIFKQCQQVLIKYGQ